jgi:Zn-dependent protease with chaperone function
METSLTAETVTLPKERTYFIILAVFSCVVWLLCTVTIFPLIGLAIGGFVVWLAHGMLIARLKSEAVKVNAEQLPELASAFASVCEDLKLKTVPDLYLMQAGGVLNAFATRFSARDFVVVYSDLLEAYGAGSGEIRFLLGHEIGHVRSRHIFKNMLLIPGLFLPLLGSAYSRACESSCDRHGSLASRDADASVRAMMILSGGRDAGKALVAEPFSAQHHSARGFFVSLHELFSSYPTLSKRVSDLLDLRNNRATPRPPRHPLAYVLALFCPGARYGIFGVLMTFYLVFIFAGIGLPVIMKVKQRAQALQHRQQQRAAEPAEATPTP